MPQRKSCSINLNILFRKKRAYASSLELSTRELDMHVLNFSLFWKIIVVSYGFDAFSEKNATSIVIRVKENAFNSQTAGLLSNERQTENVC